jgi:hypothetical protein
MITSDLIAYIRHQTEKKISKDIIISKLLGVGWYKEDINEAFLSIEVNDNLKKSSSVENKEGVVNEKIIKQDLQKVWVPQNVTIVERKPKAIFSPDIKIKKEEIVIKKEEQKKIDIQPIEIASPHPKEDFIPRLIPKNQMNSFDLVNKTETKNIKAENTTLGRINNFSAEDLPKRAMISSYERDLQSVNKDKNEVQINKKKRSYKWIIFLFIFIAIVGLVFYIFSSNLIQIEKIEALFTKKNPKILLIDNYKVFSSLSSYKAETDINISLPSFASIAAGLMSGQAINSGEKDYFSIKTNTSMNKINDNFFSENKIKMNSSIFQSEIITNIKSDDEYIFVPILDLNQIIKEKFTEPLIVRIKGDQMNLVYPIFTENIKLILDKINIHKILSGHLSSNISSSALNAYSQFINDVEIILKGEEYIKDINTYHYSINTNIQTFKNLLNNFAGEIGSDISPQSLENLQQIFGSISINSFDIWVGQKDKKIYQYNIVLDIPLSKIFGLNDKSIGDNKMNITLKAIYFDFNSPNEIIINNDFVSLGEFLNKMNIQKIKNTISNFGQITNIFKNSEGSFGLKSNLSGSCMNPVVGSLFSPTGHKEGSVNAVGLISESLNKILDMTNNIGLCYSTSKEWSLSVPLLDDYKLENTLLPENVVYFCVDSTGSQIEVNSPPTGVSCIVL